MKIAVVGLGLIGGSIAKACKQSPENIVLGYDIDRSVALRATLIGAVDRIIAPKELSEAEVVFIALYPKDAVNFVKENLSSFADGAVIMDTAGTKRGITAALAEDVIGKKFYFIGAHPMAGREFSGFEYSRDNLFDNASMILTPPKGIPVAVLAKIKKFCLSMGFGEVVITTPERHDAIIAYTSQLAHVVSNAFVKSPTSALHRGFSAGSFKDMTRVARLNPAMWRELFIDNKDNLTQEIDQFIASLTELRNAIAAADGARVEELLEYGVKCKLAADKDV